MAEKKTVDEAHYDEKIEKLHSMISTKKKRTGKIDCVVVMDLTGSMDSYINKMKEELAKLITQLSENNKDIQLRFAFVGYKDFCDGKQLAKDQPYETMTQHFSILDFTEKMEDVNKFLQKQTANGGGDTPEDLVGGFNQALQLTWQMDSHKIVILVADAPTHGKQYHTTSDDFPNGHPNPQLTLESTMAQFAKIGATFLVFRLNNETEKMFEIMKKEYKARQQKIRFIDLREILKQESQGGGYRKKKEKKMERKLSGCMMREEEEECYSVKSMEDSDGEEEEEEKEGECEGKGKKLIRASSIMNMKITEKIMVLSENSDDENEDWEKK